MKTKKVIKEYDDLTLREKRKFANMSIKKIKRNINIIQEQIGMYEKSIPFLPQNKMDIISKVDERKGFIDLLNEILNRRKEIDNGK